MTQDSRKLLVVEDDPGLQAQLRWCFEGYEVIVAGDRQTALAELKKYPFPVMTLDLGLPPDASGTSEGFATLEQVLADHPHTKIIVVTGNNERENALRAVALGAYDFFHKPIEATPRSWLNIKSNPEVTMGWSMVKKAKSSRATARLRL